MEMAGGRGRAHCYYDVITARVRSGIFERWHRARMVPARRAMEMSAKRNYRTTAREGRLNEQGTADDRTRIEGAR